MDITLGSLIAGLAALSGWLGKAWHAARKSGADETKAALNAEHHLKDFEAFKRDTSQTFSQIHERIDKEKERRAESEARQSAKFDELIKGQGVIEWQLSAMLALMKETQRA